MLYNQTGEQVKELCINFFMNPVSRPEAFDLFNTYLNKLIKEDDGDIQRPRLV